MIAPVRVSGLFVQTMRPDAMKISADTDLKAHAGRHLVGVVGRDDERERHRRDQDRKSP